MILNSSMKGLQQLWDQLLTSGAWE